MSKIAEQKALEAYPIAYYLNGGGIDDANACDRTVYEEGYDQAMQDMVKDSDYLKCLSDEIGYAYACGCRKTMQDFLEKACDYLQKNLWRVIIEDGEFRQRFVTDFKNYMQDDKI